MNERIRELAEQAAKQVSDDLRKEDEAKWYSDLPMDQSKFQEKFAELIVRECAKAAYLYTSDSKNYEHYDNMGWDCLPGDLQSHIKEHFGV